MPIHISKFDVVTMSPHSETICSCRDGKSGSVVFLMAVMFVMHLCIVGMIGGGKS